MSNKKRQNEQNRQLRAVLSEEEYTATLSDIVQRDYFPDLPALQKQAAVMNRRAVGDFPGAVAVRRAARQLEEHERACQEQEIDAEQDVGMDLLRKTPRPLHRESVTGFHARVTSEDNQEFDTTQRKEVKEIHERLQQVFAQPQLTNENNRPENESPLLASDKFNPPLNRITASEWRDVSTETNGLFFSPNHVIPSRQSRQKQALLTNGVSDTSHSPDNQLMPPPAPVKTGSSSALVCKQDMVEYVPKAASEKRIDPSKTRFPSVVSLRLPQRYQACDSSTDYSTEASTDLDSPMKPLAIDRADRVKRQKREQETFVSMTPLVVPGRSAGNESPITTWGTVSGTPMVLGGLDTAESVVQQEFFVLPAESDRDAAARRAEAKVQKAERNRKHPGRGRSSAASTPLERMTATLTPAARSLLAKSTPRPQSSARSSSAFSSALRSTYTPKPSSSQRDHSGKATPCRTPTSISREKNTTASGNITDGLLKLS